MKKIILTVAFCGITAGAFAQSESIERILQSIEQNNRELQAGAQNTEAEKLEVKAENNLENPGAEYSRKFGENGGAEVEMSVTQSFDFPLLYASRNAYGKLQGRALDLQQAVLRRDVLLRAKELCLDLIALNKMKALYEQRIKNVSQMEHLYENRLKEGDANILEVNKVKMELMNLNADVAENNAAHRTALQELLAMNGNMPLEFTETSFPVLPALKSLAEVSSEVAGTDYELRSAQAGTEAARKLVTVNKQGWLPQLEVGYCREGATGDMANGFIVGVSIPVFNNRNKVKAARARQLSAELTQEQVNMKVQADIQSLYNEASQLGDALKLYDAALMERTLDALMQAVEAGQISVLDYFTEAEAIYQNQEKMVNLENSYQKAMARLYKNSL